MENESKSVSRHVNRYLLDPNNYRFRDDDNYRIVDEGNLSDPVIQIRTYNLLVGKNNENISDLIISFKANGVLKLDPIQVKELEDKLLVVEGNRRLAALKFLYEEFKKGNDVGKLTEDSFKKLEAIQIIGESPIQHLITMGLHHISGKKKWTQVNQAQLIYDLTNKHNISEEDICNSLSISRINLKRSIRVLSLINRYKESDYGDQFSSGMYLYFEEVIKNTKMKEWLDWDDQNLAPKNRLNEEKLYSWVSRDETIEEDDNGNENTITQEPIITKRDEIRALSKILSDPKAIEQMEESRSITSAFAFSDSLGEAKFHNAMVNISKDVQTAFQFSEYMLEDDFTKVAHLRDKLDRLIPANKGVFTTNYTKASEFFSKVNTHFSNLDINQYRKLKNIKIEKLSRVNLFAGGNNMGKTSVLEAFYLLTQLNKISSLLDLERYRGKFYGDFHTKWIDRNFFSQIDLEGIFNETLVSVNIEKSESTDTTIDKTHYLSSIIAEGVAGSNNFSSQIDLYSNKEPELYLQKSMILCEAAFSSPYRYNGDLLKKAHAKSVQDKSFDEIIEFIKQKLDSSIEKIELVDLEGESRFLVSSSKTQDAIDLTKYGEGLQRVFEISLLLAFCKNGILCIDEIDSAIHKNLLIPFTNFIQIAAEKFNVQVFISTHSKECIDAFIENDYKNDEITAYALTEEDNKIVSRYLKGKKLEQLINAINIDIR